MAPLHRPTWRSNTHSSYLGRSRSASRPNYPMAAAFSASLDRCLLVGASGQIREAYACAQQFLLRLDVVGEW